MPSADVLVGPDELRARVAELAREVSDAFPDGLILVAVLKGSLPFLADLCRQLTVPVRIDFLAISAYEPDSGRVRVVKDLDLDVQGQAVLLVEDIVDTGLTLGFLTAELRRRRPASLDTCALFDKRTRRIVPAPIRFVGFEVGDVFLLGYGLDFAGRYRNLDLVVTGDVDTLSADPDAYVGELYRPARRQRG